MFVNVPVGLMTLLAKLISNSDICSAKVVVLFLSFANLGDL